MGYTFLPFKRIFDYSGRSRRMEYWMFALLNVIVAFVVFGLLGGMAGAASANGQEPTGAFVGLTVVLYIVYFVAFVIPTIALTVRRLHDQDKSGWLVLLQLVPIANFVIFVFMFLPGTVGPNQYGPDPKQVPLA